MSYMDVILVFSVINVYVKVIKRSLLVYYLLHKFHNARLLYIGLDRYRVSPKCESAFISCYPLNFGKPNLVLLLRERNALVCGHRTKAMYDFCKWGILWGDSRISYLKPIKRHIILNVGKKYDDW